MSAPQVDGATRWRALGTLFVAGGAVTLATPLTGVDVLVDQAVICGLALAAILGGVTYIAAATRLPEGGLGLGLTFGVILISGAVVASGEADNPYAYLYLWVSAEGWYFLRPRAAAGLSILTLAASAVAMTVVVQSDGDTLSWWLLLASTLIVLAVLAATLRIRAERLIESLTDAASRDPLTGLLNRRGYQRTIERELARAERYGTEVSVILGDLDDFKSLNDRLGHRQGDEALVGFAEVCCAHTRDSDAVSRVGGEEFVLILPSTGAAAATLLAERLRRAVTREIRPPEGCRVSASFGVATYPGHGSEPEVLLDHADQAMYAAKRLGRDRVVAFADDLPSNIDRADHGEYHQAVLLLAEAVDLRDPSTAAHSEVVGRLCEEIARMLGLSDDRVHDIRLAGLLHDVGKVAVPDHILRKPGKLDDQELQEIRKHPEVGARIVAGAGLDEISGWILAHHERPDGGGYPFGSAGEEILLEARIISVADAYEAMTADRSYRRAPGQAFALQELQRGCGSQFDVEVVAALRRALAVDGSRTATAGGGPARRTALTLNR